MKTYSCREITDGVICDNEEIKANSRAEAAKEYVDCCDYTAEDPSKSFFVTIRIDEKWDEVVIVDPSVPDCDDDEHVWGNESVRGNGGGVIFTETCRHCNTVRVMNTWAQNPEDGSQGHTTVTYEELLDEY